MADAINLAGADAYFAVGNHSQAEVWLKFRKDHRAGAVAEAARMFALDLRREPRAGAIQGEAIREDYGVYEQALWLLQGTPHGDASSGDALAILQGQREDADTANGARRRERWSREALRWLGWGGVVTVRS